VSGCENNKEYDVIQGGITISPAEGHSATLGCLVRKRNDDGRENIYLLTNRHVLYGEGRGPGAVVYHPNHKSDPGPSIPLGRVEPGGIRRNHPDPNPDENNPGENYYIDAAIARIDIDCIWCDSECSKDRLKVAGLIDGLGLNGNKILDVRDVRHDSSIVYKAVNGFPKVFKVGRSTGKTWGRVIEYRKRASFKGDPPDEKAFWGYNVMHVAIDEDPPQNGINCQGSLLFGDEGDSGSMVLDEQGRVIGLFVGASILDNNLARVCHIVPVLDALGVSIISEGTSHGSTSATDGSGVALHRDDGSGLPAGKIVFSSDDLHALRSTQKGRALHEAFIHLRREVSYLIRNHKLVKATWHRHKGPAFLAHVLNHLRGHRDSVPREVDGVHAKTLLVKMAEVLRRYGSHSLRAAIDASYDDGLALVDNDNIHSVRDGLAWLGSGEAAP
jgi:hypothetical protein